MAMERVEESSDVSDCCEVPTWPDTASEFEDGDVPPPHFERVDQHGTASSTTFEAFEASLWSRSTTSEDAAACTDACAQQGKIFSEECALDRPVCAEDQVRPASKAHWHAAPPSARCGENLSAPKGTSNCGSRPLLKKGTTTVMIRNIPTSVTQKHLIQELTRAGYRDCFDFCYAPRTDFHSRHFSGFAFVNFVSSQAAEDFAQDWHNSYRFGMSPPDRGLNVSRAAVQGREANMANAFSPRFRRIKNPNYKPFMAAPPSRRQEPRRCDRSQGEQVVQLAEGSVAFAGCNAETHAPALGHGHRDELVTAPRGVATHPMRHLAAFAEKKFVPWHAAVRCSAPVESNFVASFHEAPRPETMALHTAVSEGRQPFDHEASREGPTSAGGRMPIEAGRGERMPWLVSL
mmetsp:Transcript_40460/g.101619  ORF Transcript_40460/g.101619 Transcript_40460/m.101619 type:complete len:404 (+) Transcript_40460:71-1282(+)